MSLTIIALALSPLQPTPVHAQAPETVGLSKYIDPATVSLDEQVSITISLTGDDKACDPAIVRKPVDVALVIDHSGSMSEKTASATVSKLEALSQGIIQPPPGSSVRHGKDKPKLR